MMQFPYFGLDIPEAPQLVAKKGEFLRNCKATDYVLSLWANRRVHSACHIEIL